MKVVQEYERAVIFRLGRLKRGGTTVGWRGACCLYCTVLYCTVQGPGLFFVMPCIDSFQAVDMRTVSFDVPPQEVP